jgi:hypothetical protein
MTHTYSPSGSEAITLTTSERLATVFQDGVLIYDIDEDALYVGDGVTAGGVAVGGGGPFSPAGNDTEVQFNDGGNFGAEPSFVFDKNNTVLTIKEDQTVPAPENPQAVQIAGSGMLAYDYYYYFYVYAIKDGKYSNFVDFGTVDDGSGDPFDLELSWDAVPDADGYLVVIEQDDFNSYYGDWAFETISNVVTYSGASTAGLTSTFDPSNVGEVSGKISTVEVEAGSGGLTKILPSGEINLNNNQVRILPSGNFRMNSTSNFARMVIGDNSANGRNIEMTNTEGLQSTMVWRAASGSGTGYYWMFGADTLAQNANNFFIWDLLNNRPAMWVNGATGNVVFGGAFAEDASAAKLQLRANYAGQLLNVTALNNASIPITAKGNSGQTANLIRALNSSDTEVFSVGPAGQTKVGSNGTAMSAVISNTASLNFPSIAAGDTAELNITVTGAAVGAVVALGPPSTIEAGLVWSGYVSATNTVTVRVHNTTGGAIDPAVATWRAMVTNF